MKPLTILGLVLILLGVIGFATGGLTFTRRHTDAEAGSVRISHQQRVLLPLSPYLSTIALVAGVAMLLLAPRSR